MPNRLFQVLENVIWHLSHSGHLLTSHSFVVKVAGERSIRWVKHYWMYTFCGSFHNMCKRQEKAWSTDEATSSVWLGSKTEAGVGERRREISFYSAGSRESMVYATSGWQWYETCRGMFTPAVARRTIVDGSTSAGRSVKRLLHHCTSKWTQARGEQTTFGNL